MFPTISNKALFRPDLIQPFNAKQIVFQNRSLSTNSYPRNCKVSHLHFRPNSLVKAKQCLPSLSNAEINAPLNIPAQRVARQTLICDRQTDRCYDRPTHLQTDSQASPDIVPVIHKIILWVALKNKTDPACRATKIALARRLSWPGKELKEMRRNLAVFIRLEYCLKL